MKELYDIITQIESRARAYEIPLRIYIDKQNDILTVTIGRAAVSTNLVHAIYEHDRTYTWKSLFDTVSSCMVLHRQESVRFLESIYKRVNL